MFFRFFAASLVLGSFACGDVYTSPASDAGAKGVADSGETGAGGDAGTSDAGLPDAGSQGACEQGQTRACYSHGTGLSDPTRNTGVCRAGTQQCVIANGVGSYDACVDEVVPGDERCNGLDDDCDGIIDEACPTGVVLTPAEKSALFGGSGGAQFEADCDSSVVTGIDVTWGANIDSLQVRCGDLSLVQSHSEPSGYEVVVTQVPTALGPYGGTGGANEGSASCPENAVVSGFYGWTGTRVDSLGIECSTLDVVKESEGVYKLVRTKVHESPLLGSNGGSKTYDVVCKDAGALSAFKGYAIPYLYKIGGNCSTPSLSTK